MANISSDWLINSNDWQEEKVLKFKIEDLRKSILSQSN